MPEDLKVNSFSTDVLGAMEDGNFELDLTDEVRKIVQALRFAAAGGKAKATLTVKIDLTLDRGAYDVTGKFSTKLPERPRARSIFYETADKFLSRSDERQQALPLRDVGTTPIRTITE